MQGMLLEHLIQPMRSRSVARKNIMKQAKSFRDVAFPTALPASW